MILFDVVSALPTDSLAVAATDSLRSVADAFWAKVQTNPEAIWHDMLTGFLHFCVKVLIALLVYFIGAWLIKKLKQLLQRVFVRRKTEATIASFLTSLTTILSTAVLIIITVSTLGVDTTSLAAILAAGGMAVGMALSGTVQNFAGGIMLLVFKPFKVGDFIAAQGLSGTVTALSIVNTKIRTVDNREIVVPNGALSNGNIDNYSAHELRRVEWQVSVAYGVDAEACKACIRSILCADARVLDASTPLAQDPFVALSSLNANDITFIARAWVRTPDYWDAYFAINQALYTLLPQHGFEFAYPHMDVTMLPSEPKNDAQYEKN